MRYLEGAAYVIVCTLIGVLLFLAAEFDRRLEAIERALATPAPVPVAAAPAAETPAERQARYDRIYQAARDGAAAGAYVTARARAADRAHVPTPK